SPGSPSPTRQQSLSFKRSLDGGPGEYVRYFGRIGLFSFKLQLMKRNMFVAATILVLVLGALGGGIAIKVACSTLEDVTNSAGVRIPA
ncbi:hypothetical protein FS749_002838, partial [Ceratobasidium sp. UAMH 11750]